MQMSELITPRGAQRVIRSGLRPAAQGPPGTVRHRQVTAGQGWGPGPEAKGLRKREPRVGKG